jgi:TP901 family phage tail tape measure protein
MSAGAVRAGAAFVEIFAKDGKFHQAMARMQARMNRMGASMQNVGRNLAMGAAMVGAPMVLALGQFTAFDDAIRMTGAVAQATDPELASLTKRARELGATTSFTAAQVALLMAELGRAGFKPAEIEEMTGAVMNLARATGTDATLASGIMAASIRQFGLGAADATRVANTLTAAANMSFNTVEGLGEALSYAGKNAADAGMSLEETAAILGTLGNVGIQGSNAGTAVRRLLTITGAEAEKLKKIFGVSFLDADRNIRPLVDTLGEVAAATANMPSGDRMAKFNEAFGLLGITGAAAIAGAVADTRTLHKNIVGAGDIAEKTAKKMDAGLGGSLRILWSAIEGVSLAFGDALAPSLQVVAAGATWLSGVLRALLEQFPIVAQVVAAATGGVFAFGLAAIAGGFALKFLAGGLGLVKNAMTLIPALFTPMGLAVMGFSAAIAGMIFMGRQMNPEFRKSTDAIMASMSRLDFSTAWQIMITKTAIALKRMAGFFGDLWLELKNGVLDAATFIGDQLASAVNAIAGLTGAKAFETLGEEGRQKISDQRKKESDAHREFRQATIDTLRDDLRRLEEKALAKPEADQKQEDLATGMQKAMAEFKAQMPAPGESGMAGEGVKAATLSGYSSNVQGIGPQLEAAQQTAIATKEMAGKLASIDEGLKAAADIAKGKTAKTQVDRDMMSATEKMLAEVKDQTRVLKELIREVKNGGVAFA